MPSPHSETCTCIHPPEAHVIVGTQPITQPCQHTDCPCSNYQETRHG